MGADTGTTLLPVGIGFRNPLRCRNRNPLEKRYRLRSRPCVLIHHGPFDHHISKQPNGGSIPIIRPPAPPGTLNLLYFGIIRPYKGLEDLVQAFGSLSDEEVNRYWLTVVGETWQGWDLPNKRIQSSRHHARITLVNRFVDDDEVGAYFAGADAVVLPYHRSSASGPAHVAMSHGLPLVVTAVGGLPAAVADYEGAVLWVFRKRMSRHSACTTGLAMPARISAVV